MKTTHILLAAFLSLAPVAASVAQENPGIANEAEFTLHNYAPEWVNSNSLLRTISSLYGRSLHFEDRSIQNLTVLDMSLVIYEEPERLARILKAIEKLDINPRSNGNSNDSDRPPSFSADDMVLENFAPKHISAIEFFPLASDLYRRQFEVNGSMLYNLRLVSNRSIVVYEERSAVKGLLANLERLDSSQEIKTDSELVMLEYHPRHLSPNGLMEGLRPFQTSIEIIKGNVSNHIMNITVLNESGIIIIRDYKESAEEIYKTMKSLDQPAPQVMVSCQVISGVKQVDGVAASLDIQKQLLPILPHKAYQVEAAGLLRTSAVSGSNLDLSMAGSDNVKFQLMLQVGAYDEESGSLNLDNCRLSMFDSDKREVQELFSTSTTVFSGEYAVLGVTGSNPLFLVVQLLPVKAAH